MVTGAGPGGGPQVRVFDSNGHVERQFFAFDEGDRHGIFVATGDVNGDGVDEILVTAAQNGTGQIRIFDSRGRLKGAYFPFGRTSTPVRVAVGNVDEDREGEILSVLSQGGSGVVLAHDGNGRYVRSFLVIGGVVNASSLASADVDGDGISEIIVGAGKGNSPRVSMYNASGGELLNMFGYQLGFRGGVEVSAGDMDRDCRTELYLFPQSAGGPQVRIFTTEGNLIGGFFAFDPSARFGGVISTR